MSVSIETSYFAHNTFPDACIINDRLFLLFNKKLSFEGSACIDFEGYNVVFLEQIDVEENITIRAANIIFLSTLKVKNGEINFITSEKLILLGSTLISTKGIHLPENTVKVAPPKWFIAKIFNGFSQQDPESIVRALFDTYSLIKIFKGPDLALNFFSIPPKPYSSRFKDEIFFEDLR